MFDAPSRAVMSNIKNQGGQVFKCWCHDAAVLPVVVFVRLVSIVIMINKLFSRNLSVYCAYEHAAFSPHISFSSSVDVVQRLFRSKFEQWIDVQLHH